MKIRGITVTGNSRQAAEDAYRAVATGKSAKAFADANNEFVILCSADAGITPFNPLTGDADMVEAGGGIIEKMEFQSESSNVVQQTNYVVCSTGCGSHVISDDIDTRFCPACADALPDDDCPDCDEQSQNQVQTVIASQQIVVGAKTLDSAVTAFRALASTGTTDTRVCGDIAVATNLKDTFRFSPFLGDENVGFGEGLAMSAIASTDAEVEAHHFKCMSSDCGLHVIASTDDPVFCPSCSSGLIEPEEQESQSSDDEEDLDSGEYEESEEESEESEEESEDESEEEESEEEDEEYEEESEESEEEESEEDLDTGEEDEEESLSAAVVTTKSTVAVERPMLMCVAGSETPSVSKLHVSYAGIVGGLKTAVAFYDGVPVATANAKTAEAYADLLDNPKLAQAVASAAGEIGVAPALAQMGFVDIKPQIQVEEIVQQQVAEQVTAQVSEVRATAQAESKDLSSRMSAALATAAQGINSGFFKDVSNPLIPALASALSAIGMQNADVMVRKVFNEHNDGYVRNMIAKASQILNYDLQVQNELAEAVSDTVSPKETLPLGQPVAVASVISTVTEDTNVQESLSSNSFETKMNTALFSLGSVRR